MRYAVIAAFIGAAIAVPFTETIYDTKIETITSCAPEVTDCPAKKTSVPVSTTCTEEYKKSTYTAESVYMMTSSIPAPPVYVSSSMAMETSSAAAKSSSVSAPSVYVPSSMAVASSSSAAMMTSSAPAPPPYQPPTTAPAMSTGVASKASGSASASASKMTKSASVGTVSTGLPPMSPTSTAYYTKTSAPAVYTGAASHVQAAGLVMGAGAMAAFFL